MGKIRSNRETQGSCSHLRIVKGRHTKPNQQQSRSAEEVNHQLVANLLDDLAVTTIVPPLKPLALPHLLTITEFAEYCHVGKRTIHNWIRTRLITQDDGLLYLPNGEIRIDPAVWKSRLRIVLGPLLAASQILSHHALMVFILHSTHRLLIHGLI